MRHIVPVFLVMGSRHEKVLPTVHKSTTSMQMEGAVPGVVDDPIVIRIPALLHGMGQVVTCVVETWQEESSSGRLYTRCRISNEPPELPDGPYRVEFSDWRIQTNKYQGQWELMFLAPRATKPAA